MSSRPTAEALRRPKGAIGGMSGCIAFVVPAIQSLLQVVAVAAGCHDPWMDPINVTEVAPGEHRLYLTAGTDVDDVIAELGHEPNGVFWEGIVELLIMTEAPALDRRCSFDSEAGAFLAYSSDRAALDDLAIRLRAVAVDDDRVRQLVELAKSRGFEFDD